MEFTPKQYKAINLIAEGRQQYKDIAEELGISVKTLRRWRDMPGFSEEVRKTSENIFKSRLPMLFNVLFKEAEKGNFPFLRLAFERVDKLEGLLVNGDNQVTFTFKKDDE